MDDKILREYLGNYKEISKNIRNIQYGVILILYFKYLNSWIILKKIEEILKKSYGIFWENIKKFSKHIMGEL